MSKRCEAILQGQELVLTHKQVDEIAATTQNLHKMWTRMQNNPSPTLTDACSALESASTSSSSRPSATKRGKTSSWLSTIFWAVVALLFAIVCTHTLILRYNTLVDSINQEEQWNANFGGMVAANQALHRIQQMGTVTSLLTEMFERLYSAIQETTSSWWRMIAWSTSLVGLLGLLALAINPPTGASMLVTSVTNAKVAYKAAFAAGKFGCSVGRWLLCMVAVLVVTLLLDVMVSYILNVSWNFLICKALQTVVWKVLGMFSTMLVEYIIPWAVSIAYMYGVGMVEITGTCALYVLWCSKDGGNEDKTAEEPIQSIQSSDVSSQNCINNQFMAVVIVLQILALEEPSMGGFRKSCKMYIFWLPECAEVDQRYLVEFWLYMVAQAVVEKYNDTEDDFERLIEHKKKLRVVLKKSSKEIWKSWAKEYGAEQQDKWVVFSNAKEDEKHPTHAFRLDFPPFEPFDSGLKNHQNCEEWFHFVERFDFPAPCLLQMYEKIANSVVGQNPRNFGPNSIQELCYKVHQEMQRMQASEEQSSKASEDQTRLSKLQFSRSLRRMIGTMLILLVMILIPFSGLCIHWNEHQMVTSSMQTNSLNTTVAFNAILHAEKDKEEQHHRMHKKCPEGNYLKDSYYYSVLCKPHDFVEPVQQQSSTTTKEEVTNEQPPPTEQVATTDLSKTNVTVPVLKLNCEPMLPKDTSWPTRVVCYSYRAYLRWWYNYGYKTKVVMPSRIQKIGKELKKAMQYVDTFLEYTTYYVQQFELSKPTYFWHRAKEHRWDHCVLVCQNFLHYMAIVYILKFGFPQLKKWILGCKD